MLQQDTVILLKRGIRRGCITVWRERKWSTAFGALFGVFLLLQLLVLVLLGAQGITALLRSQTDLQLEIRREVSDQNVQEFFSTLQHLPYVSKATYVTREQALERAREHDPDLVTFVEKFGFENPLPDVVRVTLHSLKDSTQFMQFMQQDQWKKMIDPVFFSKAREQSTVAHELLRITQAGHSLAILFLIIIGSVIVFIITELTRARAMGRADEVMVKRVGGADTLTILVPFATEATLLSCIAIILSALCMLLFLLALPSLIPALTEGGFFSSFRKGMIPLLKTSLPLFLLLEILISPLIGTLGAWLGIRPQLYARTFKRGSR